MASRLTYSDASTPPLPGGGPTGLMKQYSERFKTLFDASALPLTSIGGTADAVTATLDPALDGSGLVDGMMFHITWTATNTAGVTLALNGGSAVPVVDAAGSALSAGALVSGLRSLLEYVGGSFRVLSPLANALSGGAGPYAVTITASTTWNKPPGYADDALVILEAIGGGKGGGRNQTGNTGTGGIGGSYRRREMRYADVPSSVSITIGNGGAGATGIANGANGGNTTIGTLLTGPGGGVSGISGGPLWDGGGSGGDAMMGAASGGSTVGGTGNSGGTSIFAGNGGNSGGSGVGLGTPGAGVAPGGGGGGSSGTGVNSVPGGAGARGEVRIRIIG